MILDSHFHLSSMQEKGMSTALPEAFVGLEVAIEAGDLEKRLLLRGNRKNIYLSVGSGPWVLDYDDFQSVDDELEKMKKEIALYGADAIGECGFDRHWNYGTMEKQYELFLRQADLAKELEKPLIIHTRESDDDVRAVLDRIDHRTIMHCFSSGKDLMYQLLDRGAYISFAGNVTYKSNVQIQECARLCPLDRILYETDSPYLTPKPLRGQPNRPEYTEYTLAFLASLRGESPDVIKENALRNLKSLMKDRESVTGRDGTL